MRKPKGMLNQFSSYRRKLNKFKKSDKEKLKLCQERFQHLLKDVEILQSLVLKKIAPQKAVLKYQDNEGIFRSKIVHYPSGIPDEILKIYISFYFDLEGILKRYR